MADFGKLAVLISGLQAFNNLLYNVKAIDTKTFRTMTVVEILMMVFAPVATGMTGVRLSNVITALIFVFTFILVFCFYREYESLRSELLNNLGLKAGCNFQDIKKSAVFRLIKRRNSIEHPMDKSLFNNVSTNRSLRLAPLRSVYCMFPVSFLFFSYSAS